MTLLSEESVKTRRWSRVEYDRLVELGMFDGERLELLDGLLVVREPQKSPHAATVTQVGHVLDVPVRGRSAPTRHRGAAGRAAGAHRRGRPSPLIA